MYVDLGDSGTRQEFRYVFVIHALKLPKAWIALLFAVFPVHLHIVIHSSNYPAIPFWAIVARIPLQFLLIAWVERSTRYRFTES